MFYIYSAPVYQATSQYPVHMPVHIQRSGLSQGALFPCHPRSPLVLISKIVRLLIWLFMAPKGHRKRCKVAYNPLFFNCFGGNFIQDYSLSLFSLFPLPKSQTLFLIISYNLCESQRKLIPRGNRFTLPQQPLSLAACDLGLGPCAPLWHVNWCCPYAGLVQANILLGAHGYIFLCCVHMCMGDYKTTHTLVLWFLLPTSSSLIFPYPQVYGSIQDISGGVGHPTVTYSLRSDQLWMCISLY